VLTVECANRNFSVFVIIERQIPYEEKA